MIDLSAGRIGVCMTIPARWPVGYSMVRRQFAGLGVHLGAIVTSPDGLPIIPPGEHAVALRFHDAPPASWTRSPGLWYHLLAWRECLKMGLSFDADSFLIVEDDCLVTEHAAATLSAATLPPEWDCLYLGAMHGYGSTELAGDHLLRIRGSLATHAVLYHRRAIRRILDLPMTGAADCLLAEHLHPDGHCYALWPQAVIQLPGVSTITGAMGGDACLWETRGKVLDGMPGEG